MMDIKPMTTSDVIARRCARILRLLLGVALIAPMLAPAQISYPSTFQIVRGGAAVIIEDYAALPLSGRGGSVSNFNPAPVLSDQLARVTFVRAEPTNAPLSNQRFFVVDMNRNLYVLTKSNKTFTTYLNFQSIFRRFYNSGGFAGGLNPIAFDPEYASNGLFYSAHLETNSVASGQPTNFNHPNLDLTGYTTTARVNPPTGTIRYESVLVEWHDTNIANATFEGTAREILRVGLNDRIHPMGDLMFNPLTQPGDADYRNLYIAQGDGSAGENSATRTTPQRLDALPGKILRITPDVTLRTADELSANGRYRIPTTGPDANPFVSLSLSGLRKEIYAYGLRNCHRFSWDPVANVIVECDIGLNSWEEVNLIRKGGNYGYSEREGAEQLFIGGANSGKTGSSSTPVVPFPTNDVLTVAGLANPVAPVYPVALYSHRDGDSIGSGFVYRGKLLPALYGKFIFGDIANGRLFYSDFDTMLAVDDGNLNTVAPIYELQLVYDNPLDTPDAGYARWRFFDLVALSYTNRGGSAGTQRLPGGAASTDPGKADADGVVYGVGRVDLRLSRDNDGELLVTSKSDGMIRRLTSSLGPPLITAITNNATAATLTWQSVPGWNYRLQFKSSLTNSVWGDVAGDVTAAGIFAAKTVTLPVGGGFYRVKWLP